MGKKSRKNKWQNKLKLLKKKMLNTNLPPVQSNQPKPAQINLWQVIRKSISPASTFISAILFGFGVQGMNTGSVLAPWLIAVGALMVAFVILTNQDIWSIITKRISKYWQKALIFIIICAIFFVPTLIVLQNVANNQRDVLSRTPIFLGVLTPGNAQDPYNSYKVNLVNIPTLTPIPPDSFRVMLGDDSGIFIDSSVNTTFGLKGKPFMTIKTNKDGIVVLNTKVLDSTNNRIVAIVDNEFQADPQYAFKPIQPDKHSLVVRDFDGVEVLNIKYINSKTLWITGRFFLPNESKAVTISASGLIELGNIEIRGIYMVGGEPGGFINLGGE
jgi:hypothetical protein